MGQQSMVGLLLKGRRLWQKGSLLCCEDLSRQLCICCSFHSTHQGMQNADVVQLSSVRAHMASPPGYEGPVYQNGGLLSTHRLETLTEHILSNKKTLELFNGGQCFNNDMSMDCFIRRHHGDLGYPKLFNTTAFEPASTSRSDASGITFSKISVFGATAAFEYSSGFVGFIPHIRRTYSGLWSWRRRDPLWIGRRSFFSAGISESLSNLKSGSLDAFMMTATDVTVEAETNASSSESDEDYDFRNFPALTSSFYQDYESPIEMKPKKHVAWQTSRKLDSKLTLESIPEPKGRTYDFGLGDMFSKPPPLEEGARPQGGFDIDISLDECEEAPPERLSSFPVFPQRMRSHKLPWDTPEADNWSEITTDSRDSVSKQEQEFCWDPYDFDASVKLPHKLDLEESFSANVPAH